MFGKGDSTHRGWLDLDFSSHATALKKSCGLEKYSDISAQMSGKPLQEASTRTVQHPLSGFAIPQPRARQG